jgi:hypothetical protein
VELVERSTRAAIDVASGEAARAVLKRLGR